VIKSDNRLHYRDIARKGSDSIRMSWKRSGVVHGMSHTHMIVLAHSRECKKMQKSAVSKIVGSSTFNGFGISVGTFRCHDTKKLSAELEWFWHGFGAHFGAKGCKKPRVQILIVNHWKFAYLHHISPKMDNHDKIGIW
jgi:hypothetical protein